MKQKVLDQYILSTMTYGAETWTFTKNDGKSNVGLGLLDRVPSLPFEFI